jgi:hypothetical protein
MHMDQSMSNVGRGSGRGKQRWAWRRLPFSSGLVTENMIFNNMGKYQSHLISITITVTSRAYPTCSDMMHNVWVEWQCDTHVLFLYVLRTMANKLFGSYAPSEIE